VCVCLRHERSRAATFGSAGSTTVINHTEAVNADALNAETHSNADSFDNPDTSAHAIADTGCAARTGTKSRLAFHDNPYC
jgi:hypothetical protein